MGLSVHINNFTGTSDPTLFSNPLDNLVLTRICCKGGATKSAVFKDLKSLLAGNFGLSKLRIEIDSSILRLFENSHVEKSEGRLLATRLGLQQCSNFLGMSFSELPSWKEVKDIGLIGKALGLNDNFSTCRSILADSFFVWALILQKKYHLKFRLNISKEELCQQLALISLEKAFGTNAKNLIKKNLRLSPKLARLFASFLSDSGKDFSSYRSLFLFLAAEIVGAPKISEDAVKSSLNKNLMAELFINYAAIYNKQKSNEVSEFAIPTFQKKSVAKASKFDGEGMKPPSLQDFAFIVCDIARQSAQGWSGNRKIFISQVWDALAKECKSWGLSEGDFKRMLTEAHRRGELLLSNADLKSEDLRYDIERSATHDRNAVWHYVKVKD